MRDIVARIADIVVDLNAAAVTVSDNDTVEFDVDKRLDVLEVVVDDLNSTIEDSLDFAKDTSG